MRDSSIRPREAASSRAACGPGSSAALSANSSKRVQSCSDRTAVVESRLFLSTGNITSLSEQFLLDCDQSRVCGGCCGGLPETSLQWLAGDSGAPGGGTGISSEADYPYDSASGTDPNPRCDDSKPRIATLTGFGVLNNPDDASVMVSHFLSTPITLLSWQR